MLIWHQRTKELLQQYEARLKTTGEAAFPFVILSGVSHIGKMTLLRELAMDIVGANRHHDILVLEDCSEDLDKAHSLKLELPPDEQVVEKKDGSKVQDLGIRQLVQRMTTAPIGERKICILENIERMSLGAANAFLKTAEEPLPNRLILATTSNESTLLETIRSRAWLLPCSAPSHEDVIAYLQQQHPELSEQDARNLAMLVGDRVGLALSLIKEYNDQLHVLLQDATQLMKLLIENRDPFASFESLQRLSKTLGTDMVLEYIIFAGSAEGKQGLVEACFTAKRYLQARVGEDNVLFGLAYGTLWIDAWEVQEEEDIE